MRFGIMTLQNDALIPPGMSSEDVVKHISDFDHAAIARGLVENGFDPIELSGDMALFLPQSFAPLAIEKLLALKEETGVSYTAHLPLWSVELSTPLSPVREGSVKAVIDIVRATLPLEPEVYVLHATGALAAEFYRIRLTDTAKALLLRLFQNNARQSLERILAETGISSRKLAIETIEFPFDLTLELAEELDLSICLDTGHILVGFAGPLELFDVLERCLPRLAEIHLHDGPWQGPEHNIGYVKDHQALGKGDLDTGRLLDRLIEANFTGPVILELTAQEALRSLDVIRSLRPTLLS